MSDAVTEARAQVARFGETLTTRVRERPWPSLAIACMAGYVAGGGLFSSFTRPLARAALGALLVPGVRERVRGLVDDVRPTQATGAA